MFDGHGYAYLRGAINYTKNIITNEISIKTAQVLYRSGHI